MTPKVNKKGQVSTQASCIFLISRSISKWSCRHSLTPSYWQSNKTSGNSEAILYWGLQGFFSTLSSSVTTEGSSRPCPTNNRTLTIHLIWCHRKLLASIMSSTVEYLFTGVSVSTRWHLTPLRSLKNVTTPLLTSILQKLRKSCWPIMRFPASLIASKFKSPLHSQFKPSWLWYSISQTNYTMPTLENSSGNFDSCSQSVHSSHCQRVTNKSLGYHQAALHSTV